MKKELGWDYDITVDNMIPMTKEQEIGNFKLHETEFGSQKKKGLVKMNVLTIGQAGCDGCRQIFQMNDGKFILEVEDEGMVDYYYSKDITDLLCE